MYFFKKIEPDPILFFLWRMEFLEAVCKCDDARWARFTSLLKQKSIHIKNFKRNAKLSLDWKKRKS